MAPLKAQNYITLMEGTENQKSFYLQNPSQPTEEDILKIKKAYGIDPDTTLEQTRDLLNKIEAGEIKSPLATLPEGPAGFGELYERAADVAERAELIKDPLQYYGNTFLCNGTAIGDLGVGLATAVSDPIAPSGNFMFGRVHWTGTGPDQGYVVKIGLSVTSTSATNVINLPPTSSFLSSSSSSRVLKLLPNGVPNPLVIV